MYGRKHIHRVAALLTAVAALAFFAGSVQAANSRPAGMTKAEYRALMLRSEALNKQYHLGAYSRLPQSMTAAEYRALMLRSEALNKKYHLGSWAVPPASTTVSTGGGFAWSAFGIGAAAMLGVVLLASGAIVGSRHGRRAPRPRISS
jgi:hypothetical protein